MTEKHSKRPRDLNQWAKRMVDLATGEAEERVAAPDEPKSASARGRMGGKKGGPARAKTLSPEQRQDIARDAAHARWKSKKI
jgi:hypothetical protein